MANKFTPPPMAPDLLARQMKMMQDAEVAKMRMQQGMQTPQGQMVSGHYVAPHWSQNLAQGLNRYLGEKGMAELPGQQAELQQMQQQQMMNQFGFGQPSPQALAQGLGTEANPMPLGEQPQPQMQPQMQGGMPMQQGMQQQSGMQPHMQQQGQPGQGPMMLPGLSPQQSMMALQTLGPAEYMKAYNKQFEPTPEQRNLSHLSPQQRNQLLEASALQNAAKDGVQMIRGADGQIYSVPVQGYAQSQAALQGGITGAQEQARAGYDLVEVPDGQGGSMTMPRSQAIAALSGNQPGQPGQQFGEKLPETVLEARASLPKVTQQSTQMIASIDGLLNHPGLSDSVGLPSYLPVIRGTPRADFEERRSQLGGQAFLQAFESLKGGGQITEIEGAQAKAAMGRMSNAQSEKEYRNSLEDLRGILEAANQRAYDSARLPMPNSRPTQSPQEISGRGGASQRPNLADIFGG